MQNYKVSRTQNTVYSITANAVWANMLAKSHCCLPYIIAINSFCTLGSCPTAQFLRRDKDSPDTPAETNIKKAEVLKEAQLDILYCNLKSQEIRCTFASNRMHALTLGISC